MYILINGQLATLPQGSSFDFVSENRYFTGSDSYSLGITFPLKDCPGNLAIFGNINRKDVPLGNVLFDCELRDRSFVKRGSITITSISDIEVETQFLEGRSKENFCSSFDDISINTLNLGYPATGTGNYAYGSNRTLSAVNYVALPWVNNNTGNVQNRPADLTLAQNSWHADTKGLSFQPYLYYLLQLIFSSIGYTCDLSAITSSKWRYLLVCNTLPFAWELSNWARALPDWSLTELLEQVEYLLNGEFTIDHSARTVSFAFSASLIESLGSEEIEKVINEFSAEVSDESDIEYRDAVTLKYADCDHAQWQYYSCPWLIENAKQKGLYKEFADMAALIAYLKSWCTDYDAEKSDILALPRGSVFCAKEEGVCFIGTEFYCGSARHNVQVPSDPSDGRYYYGVLNLQQVNMFGPAEGESTKDVELSIVPAWIDECYVTENSTATSLGECIFLDLPDYDNTGVDDAQGTDSGLEALQMLEKGEDSDTAEYLDKLYVAFWDNTMPKEGKLDCPAISPVSAKITNIRDVHQETESGTVVTWICTHDYAYSTGNYSLQLRNQKYGGYQSSYRIDGTRKYTFQWLADEIPNVRKLFLIRGRRYVCEKITATFTESGMSQLLEGEFYPLTD